MLIIAIPKSCSTSLMKTIGNINGLKYQQKGRLRKKYRKCKSTCLHKIHSDMIEYDKKLINQLVNSKIVYKQHIFPSKHNLNLIKDKKCVILLRDPNEIIKSYMKAFKKSGNHGMDKFNLKKEDTFETYLNTFKKNGLYQDLVNFNQKYIESANKNHLVIYKDNIVKDTDRTINNVQRFFGLPEKKNITLARERYIS